MARHRAHRRGRRARGPAALSDPLRVLVATPLGRGGAGGIDRMMDAVRARLAADAPDLAVAFATTRGQGALARASFHLAAALARLARRPDLLHLNLSGRGSTLRKLVLAEAARRLGVPFVVHLHGSAYDAYWDAAPAPLRALIRRMFAGAARVVVLGEAWREAVALRVPEAADRVVVLPNAVAAAPPTRGGAVPTILFLGRLGQRKGVSVLVEALARLPADLPWRAVLAGDGAVDATAGALAARGLADRVALPGWLDAPATERLLAESDILALPSRAENLPMAVIEAMAHGLAVVATPVGAVTEIVAHGRTGLLVPPGDAGALARALETLLRDPALRRSLGEAAQADQRRRLELADYVARLTAIWRAAAR